MRRKGIFVRRIAIFVFLALAAVQANLASATTQAGNYASGGTYFDRLNKFDDVPLSWPCQSTYGLLDPTCTNTGRSVNQALSPATVTGTYDPVSGTVVATATASGSLPGGMFSRNSYVIGGASAESDVWVEQSFSGLTPGSTTTVVSATVVVANTPTRLRSPASSSPCNGSATSPCFAQGYAWAYEYEGFQALDCSDNTPHLRSTALLGNSLREAPGTWAGAPPTGIQPLASFTITVPASGCVKVRAYVIATAEAYGSTGSGTTPAAATAGIVGRFTQISVS